MKPPSTENCNLTCKNNHPIKYYEDTSEYYKSRTGIGGYNIGCDNCGIVFGGGSWHCRKCQYDLCNSCIKRADSQINSRKLAKSLSPEDCNLTCAKNHPLKYCIDTSEYYNGHNIRCDYCGIIFHGASWHCRPCKYDLCDRCKKINDFFNESVEIDNWSSDSDSEEDNILSESVERYNGTSDSDSEEDNTLSESVEIYVGIRDSDSEQDNVLDESVEIDNRSGDSDNEEERGVTCDNNHRLECNNYRRYICNICRNHYIGTSWYCSMCDYDLCKSCYKKESYSD